MSVDLQTLRALVDAHGIIARVVVAQAKGSAPRDSGTVMHIWSTGACGTIGGGALEFEAIKIARKVIDSGNDLTQVFPLGPALGQCCGGSVILRTDIFDAQRVEQLSQHSSFIRGDGARPSWATSNPILPNTDLHYANGWIAEPIEQNKTPLWIWGAGHVGRALVDVIAPLEQHAITWIDVHRDRFPEQIRNDVDVLTTDDPQKFLKYAPPDAQHLIVTYSHVLDLNLCHGLLTQKAKTIGLIGSQTKWARFQSRLRNLGHSQNKIDLITCPIGDPALGKHPHAIAIGVASALISTARPTGLDKNCSDQKDRA